MRKILAGFLATSMIVAMASATTFAAGSASSFNISTGSDASFGVFPSFDGIASTVPIGATDVVTPTGANWEMKMTYKQVDIVLPQTTIKIPLNVTKNYSSVTATAVPSNGTPRATYQTNGMSVPASDLLFMLDGKTFSTQINGIAYTGKLTRDGGNIRCEFDQNGPVDVSIASVVLSDYSIEPILPTYTITTSGGVVVGTYKDAQSTWSGVESRFTAPTLATSSRNTGSGTFAPDESQSGTFDTENIRVNDVVWSDAEGNPMVFTEKKSAVDEDQNTEGGVQSGKTLYFLIRSDGPVEKLDDDTYWKMKITKGDNGKYIKSVTDVSKIFGKGLYPLNGSEVFGPTVNRRQRYIKVEMNEVYNDDEFKMTLDMRISAKSKAVDAGVKIGTTKVTDDSEYKVKDFYFYMKNLVKDADNDWKVGITGLMLNPLSNDWNDVTWYDEDGDLAHMKFFADSDVGKFYSKLSTKWEHADYASYFNDQDAYIFDFTGSPKLSATSRADLEIYNPFLDEDGNETIDPATAVIYQVIDGDLFDVTDSFEYKEGDNGDMAFVTRTRFLGTYIISEKPVEEAADTEAPDTDLVPEEAPSEVTPDGGSNDGGKAPANTGKYL